MKIYRDGKWREWKVYTKEEADKEGIKYVYWKDATEKLQWVLTDDDYVVQVIRLYEMPSSGVKEIVTPIGKNFTRKSCELRWGTRKDNARHDAPKARRQAAIEAYVAMILAGQKVDYDFIGKILQSKSRKPGATARVFLRRESVKEMIAQELRERLKEMGIGEITPYEILLEAREIALQKGDALNLIRVAENLQEIFGHKGSKVKTVETLEASDSVTKLIEEEEQTETKRIVAKRETEEPL